MTASHHAATAQPQGAFSVAGYYDAYWSAEQERRYEPDPHLWSLILDGVTSCTRCLDVGCGPGNSYAGALRRRAASYVGVDISAAAVQEAQGAGLDARVIEDATQLPFDDESFDRVVCVEVFEHLFAPHRAAAEIWRVLAPGGRLVASTPNVAYWRLRANMVFGLWNPVGDELSIEQPWRDPHIRFFTPATLTRMLKMAGFSQVSASAHNGRLLDHLTARPTRFGRSEAYAALERRWPSLFGLAIHAAATK